jgi:hypothetical protein
MAAGRVCKALSMYTSKIASVGKAEYGVITPNSALLVIYRCNHAADATAAALFVRLCIKLSL